MMTPILDLLTGDWAHRLGWTLLHSLWQALVIFSALAVCLRLIPAQRSRLRYALACTSLLVVVLSSSITYISVDTAGPPGAHIQERAMSYVTVAAYSSQHVSTASQIFSGISSFISIHMSWILTAWVAGFLFFALRFVLGLIYNQKLITSAIRVENEWAAYIQHTAVKLGINQVICLAESAAISTPMVIGYLKPVILVPVGMLTGLSPEQLQTIFVHELAHIRRYDYLINVIQSFIQVVFFFNPFVRTISGIIRREREYCCDDVVIRQHGGVRAYAYALAQLAESNLTTPALALPVTGNKNQLLNRIRRVMEKSVGNYSAKNRIMVPAILILAGLLCISWLGIQNDPDLTADQRAANQDTVVKEEGNGVRYSRKSIITIDEDGQLHEEITKEFEGDTIPRGMNFRNHRDWEEFSRAFEERFGERFGDLFAQREAHLSDMMKELEEKFGSEDWPSHFDFDLPPMAFDTAGGFFDKESFRKLKEELEQLRSLDLERFDMLNDRFDAGSGKMQRYEDVLLEQLRNDGYLSEGETIQSLEWNDEVIKVNGTKIREEDKEKYLEINRQYFNKGSKVE